MFLLDDVKVQAGGNGPLVGSGGVGGAIFMDANINFKKRMQVKLFSTFGSFGQMQQGVALEGSTGKVILIFSSSPSVRLIFSPRASTTDASSVKELL